jgi:carboxyl-terminal processing protease
MDEFETQQNQQTMVQQMEPQYSRPPKDHRFGHGVLVGVLISFFVVILSALVGLLVYRGTAKPKSAMSEVVDEDTARKIDFITSILDEYYYEDPDVDDLREGIYAGLVSGLNDPYSA